MLNMSYTRENMGGSDSYDLAAAAGSFQEGAFMVATMENGVEVVAPCAGTSGEQFVGVAKFYRQVPATGPVVEDRVVPASPYQVTLIAAPIGGEAAMTFVDVSTGQPGSVITGADITVSGALVTFTAAEVGKTVRMTYVANYTQAMANRLVGSGMYASSVTPNSPLAKVGVIKTGKVATSYYDPAINWNAPGAGAITLDAGGRVTFGGSGEAIKARVLAAPYPGNEFLQLELLGGNA